MNTKKIGKKVLASLRGATAHRVENAVVARSTSVISKLSDLTTAPFLNAGNTNTRYLISGRRDKFAEAVYGIKYKKDDGDIDHDAGPFSWIARPVPKDLRRSILWNGRLPDGREKYWLSYNNVTEEDEADLRNGATKTGVRFAAILASATFLFGISCSASLPTLPSPAYGDWISALPPMQQFHAYASGTAVFTIDVIGKLLEFLTSNAWPVVGSAILSAATFAFSLPAGTALALSRSLEQYKGDLTFELSKPSQDSMHLWEGATIKRLDQMKVYARAVREALGWRKNQPLLRLGIASGGLKWKGLESAPECGQDVCVDGISMRSNVVIMGTTGAGKTRDALKPFAKIFMETDWDNRDEVGHFMREHKAGMVVLDGKGKLAYDIMSIVPKDKLGNVRLITTENGGWVMDITAGLTIPEIGELYFLLAKQKAGSVETLTWIEGSMNAFMAAGNLGKVVKTERLIVEGKDLWANRNCQPTSILGMYAIATEMKLNQAIAKHVLDEVDRGRVYDQSIIDAARWFAGYWQELAPETRGSFVSNISTTFGDLVANKRLAEMFASGETGKYPTVKIEECLEGKYLLVALSEITDGKAGLLVANFIKHRGYFLAQKRLAEASRATELLKRVDACKENYVKLHTRSGNLNRLELMLQDIEFPETDADVVKLEAEAVALFQKHFPKEKTFSLARMKLVVHRDLDNIESILTSFTEEVHLLAFPEPDNLQESLELAQYYRDAIDAPMLASCAMIIDEFQDYVTTGDGGKSDATFINKARETGMFLVTATQSMSAISRKIGHDETKNMMTNFGNKIIFRTDDTETREYCVQIAGSAFQSKPYSKNLYANATQQLGLINREKIEPVTTRLKSLFWPNLKSTIGSDDPFYCDVQKVDVGAKAELTPEQWKRITQGRGDKVGVFEFKSQKIQEEEAIEKQVTSGSEQPLITVNDLEDYEQGYAFVMWNRAGITRKDFVDMRLDQI